MPFLSWIIFIDLLQICPWAVVAFRYLHAPEDALVLSSWRTCTKKAQRNALSFNLLAEREAPRNCPYNPLNIKHLHNYELCSYGLCMAKRILKMAIRCLLCCCYLLYVSELATLRLSFVSIPCIFSSKKAVPYLFRTIPVQHSGEPRSLFCE